MGIIRRALKSESIAAYAAAVIVLVASWILTPSFFSPGNLIGLLFQVVPYVLVTLAQMLAMVLAGIDLAVGAMVGLSSALVAVQLGHGALDVLVLVEVVVLCASVSALTGLFIAYARVPALVVTLATSFMWSGLALVILPQPGGVFPPWLAKIFTGSFGGIPYLLVLLVLVTLAFLCLDRSRTGTHIYAVGSSTISARLTGLSVIRSHVVSFGIGGGLSAIAGIVLAAQTSSGDAAIGEQYTLGSIAAAVIGGVSLFGGRGRYSGAIAGAIVFALLTNLLLYAGVDSFAQIAVQGGILLVIVLLSAWRSRARERARLLGLDRATVKA